MDDISRECPMCKHKLVYSCVGKRNWAEKQNTVCRSCTHIGKKASDETKRKMSEKALGNKRSLGYKFSIQAREKLRHKNISDSTREKLREHRLRQIEMLGYKGPAYNKKACRFIEWLNIFLGLNFRHAENGGECRVSGYSLDGYDIDKNIVFEYDEKTHKTPIYKEKDLQRQFRIINKIKPIMFIRFDEQENRLYDAITNSTIEIYAHTH